MLWLGGGLGRLGRFVCDGLRGFIIAFVFLYISNVCFYNWGIGFEMEGGGLGLWLGIVLWKGC